MFQRTHAGLWLLSSSWTVKSLVSSWYVSGKACTLDWISFVVFCGEEECVQFAYLLTDASDTETWWSHCNQQTAFRSCSLITGINIERCVIFYTCNMWHFLYTGTLWHFAKCIHEFLSFESDWFECGFRGNASLHTYFLVRSFLWRMLRHLFILYHYHLMTTDKAVFDFQMRR